MRAVFICANGMRACIKAPTYNTLSVQPCTPHMNLTHTYNVSGRRIQGTLYRSQAAKIHVYKLNPNVQQ